MLEIIKTKARNFGEEIAVDVDIDAVRENLFKTGTVYCIKNCFSEESIDNLKKEIFNSCSSMHTECSDTAPINDNYCCIARGISKYQKALHYFHTYYFKNLDGLPPILKPQLKELFSSMAMFYNKLTSQNRDLIGTHADGKKFQPQIIQYPVGGGMFSSHIHPLEPQKLGLILSLSKRGRDFKEGSAGFEMPDGTIVDTSDAHDIGDMLIFKYDLKHWVLPCDLAEPLIDGQPNGRWSAVLPIY